MPQLGIGLPVYNAEATIKKTLNSILNQTFKDFSLYIFDNSSQDRTCSIIEEYAKKDKRIVLYKNSINVGLHPNFNKCLSIRGHDYISIMSSNDVIYPEYYEECIRFLNKNKDYVLCYTEATNTIRENLFFSYEQNNILERAAHLIETFIYGNKNYGVYRASALDKVLPYATISGADHVFMFNLSLIGKFKKIEKVLYDRETPAQRTNEQYRRACHSSIKSTPEPNIPNIKIVELLLGHINVCNNGYLNGLNREELVKQVVLSIKSRWRRELRKEISALKKHLFFKRFQMDSIDYFELNQDLKKVQYYLKKVSKSELKAYNRSKYCN